MRPNRILPSALVATLAAASLAGCAFLPGIGGGAGDTFCADLEDAGGSAAIPGVVPLFYPKEDLLLTVDQGIAALEVTPPVAIQTEWATTRDFYADVKVAAEALDAGAIMSNPELYERSDQLSDEIETISGYILDNCN